MHTFVLFSSNDEDGNARCCVDYNNNDGGDDDAEKGRCRQQHNDYHLGADNRAAAVGSHGCLSLVCNTYLVTMIASGFTAKLKPTIIDYIVPVRIALLYTF